MGGKRGLGRVALLALTAGHPGGADARTQDGLGAGGQVVDGAGQILEGQQDILVQGQRRVWTSRIYCCGKNARVWMSTPQLVLHEGVNKNPRTKRQYCQI